MLPILVQWVNERKWDVYPLRCVDDAEIGYDLMQDGVDGLAVRELRKIPADVLTIVFNSWLAFSTLPAELRSSRTVFIPKNLDAATAAELRTISISSLVVGTYTRLLLLRLQEDHPFFTPYRVGFRRTGPPSPIC